MKKAVIFCLLVLVLPLAAYCQQESRIELTDGSVINGEIVSFVNGVYTVNTSAFGQIKIGTGQVAKVQSVNPSVSPLGTSPFQTSNPVAAGLDGYKQKVLNNPENTAIITGLATDPQIQDLAEDPQIINAAKSGDIQALMQNKKFMDVINDPRFREEMDRLKE